MNIAIASGKGGTGKTMLSVAMAQVFKDNVTYIDCDVEEPNGHIFLRPEIEYEDPVKVTVPYVHQDKCEMCGKCEALCQFNAIAVLNEHTMVFPDLCHSCDGCFLVCTANALYKKKNTIGTISVGMSGPIRTVEGKLNVGKSIASPVVRAAKQHIKMDGLNIIDCPPGTTCPAIAAINGADFVILVTEPTPFGLHDLKLAVETTRELGIPLGVVINRSNSEQTQVHNYCEKDKIPILLEIPESRTIAEAYSCGETILEVMPELKTKFIQIGVYAETQMKGVK